MLATVAEERCGLEASTSAPTTAPAVLRLSLDAPRARPMRRAASTPTLHSMAVAPLGGEEAGLEVYVVVRNFKEFGGALFRRMPPAVRNGCRDMGICHYQVAFRRRDGTLIQVRGMAREWQAQARRVAVHAQQYQHGGEYKPTTPLPPPRLPQFDFGPRGGDIHIAQGPLAALLNKNRRRAARAARRAATAQGEVRAGV